METIWAPWRMSFILGEKPVGCFLCDAPGVGIGEESLVLQLTEHSMVIMNRYPYVAGHLMVAPRRHVDRPDALSPVEHRDLHETLTSCIARIRDAAGPDGVNVGMNLGAAAGAGVRDHIHYHVVPRFIGDSNAFNVFAEVRVVPEDLVVTWRRLRPAFEKM